MMSDLGMGRVRSPGLRHYAWVLSIAWTVAVAASLVWNVIQVRQNTLEAVRIQARTAFDKDVIYRRWNAGHGGVYAPVSEAVQPNPYLDVQEREITTPLGKSLTLINPAYMTRQVHELAEQEYGVRGHITSLNPIRPANAPDPWETEALQAFERGESESSLVVALEGQEYMRLMRPLITEEGCLQCHAAQGYRLGEVRGGISVSVPMGPLWAVARTQVFTLAVAHVPLWLMGLGGVVVGTRRLVRSSQERERAEGEREALIVELAAKNVELEQFAYVVSHDLRAPLRAIHSYAEFLREDLKATLNDEQQTYLDGLGQAVHEAEALIADLLELSRLGRHSFQVETVDVGVLLRDFIAALALPDEVEVVMAEDWPTLEMEPTLLRQIFQNLIENAVKFNESSRKRVELGWRAVDGEGYELYVRDNGIGIDPRYHEQIFGVFTRLHTREEYEGTGIGLAIVKKAAEKLGGAVRLESEPGKGSTFFVMLPEILKEV